MKPELPKVVVTDFYGLCDYQAKTITLDSRQTKQQMLDTLVHESLHWAFPFLTEKQVQSGGEVIGAILWKQGYRIKK